MSLIARGEHDDRRSGQSTVDEYSRPARRCDDGEPSAPLVDAATIDVALLFGVVPFPTLPLNRLLPEMHRVLKADGILALWLFPVTAGVPTAVLRSGLFTEIGKKNGTHSYRRAAAAQNPLD